MMRMQIIKEEFFTGENFKLLKHINSSKNLKSIVLFVFNIMSYILQEAGIQDQTYEKINLLIGN